MSFVADNPKSILPFYALVVFALLTFGVTWSVIGGYIYFPGQATATFGEISGSHPLYFLATWAVPRHYSFASENNRLGL